MSRAVKIFSKWLYSKSGTKSNHGIATAKLICNNCTLNFYLSNLIDNTSIWRNWFIDCPTKNCVSWSFFEVGSFDVRHVWHIILGGSQKLEKLQPHFAVAVQHFKSKVFVLCFFFVLAKCDWVVQLKILGHCGCPLC